MKVSWRVWVPCGLLAVLAGAIAGAWKWSGLADANNQLENRRLLARKLGIALTVDELQQLSHFPDDENAVPRYARVLPTFESATPSVKRLSQILVLARYGLTASEYAEAAGLLRGLGPSLARIQSASRYPALDFHRNWSQGPEVDLREHLELRMASRCLMVRILVKCRERKAQSALGDVETIQRISQQLFSEPMSSAYFTGFVTNSLAMRGLQLACAVDPGDKVALKRARTIVELGKFPDCRRLLSGETAMWMQGLKLIATGKLQDEWTLGPAELARYTSVRTAFESKILEQNIKLYQEFPEDPAEFERVGKAALRSEVEMENSKDLVTNMMWGVMPTFGHLDNQLRTMAAHKRLALTAIELMSSGPPYPAKLANPAPDPFGSHPLTYKREGKGFLLYSYGSDRTDEGGVGSWEEYDPRGSDLVWRYPLKPPTEKRPKPYVPGGPPSLSR